MFLFFTFYPKKNSQKQKHNETWERYQVKQYVYVETK